MQRTEFYSRCVFACQITFALFAVYPCFFRGFFGFVGKNLQEIFVTYRFCTVLVLCVFPLAVAKVVQVVYNCGMNNVNYDKQMTEIIQGLSNVPRLLLHVCCAPCASYCLTQLITHFDVTLYYSNDNITDKTEWDKRLAELQRLTDIVNGGNFVTQPVVSIKLVVPDYNTDNFFAVASGLEAEPEGGARCKQCFAMRLGNSARYAQDNGYDYFATTLTVSPHKNCQLINQIGNSLATADLLWLPTDFKKRNGYLQSIQLCAKYNIYRQNYCGCAFSCRE